MLLPVPLLLQLPTASTDLQVWSIDNDHGKLSSQACAGYELASAKWFPFSPGSLHPRCSWFYHRSVYACCIGPTLGKRLRLYNQGHRPTELLVSALLLHNCQCTCVYEWHQCDKNLQIGTAIIRGISYLPLEEHFEPAPTVVLPEEYPNP
jgi:hypothetical protein